MSNAEQVTRICACDERYLARARGEFVFMDQWQGWVFPDDTPRFARDSWRSSYYGTEDHTGEPFVWQVCPFCGGDLPPQDSFNPYLQSDGCAGEGPE